MTLLLWWLEEDNGGLDLMLIRKLINEFDTLRWKTGIYFCVVLLCKVQTQHLTYHVLGTALTCFFSGDFCGVKTISNGWSFPGYEEDEVKGMGRMNSKNMKVCKIICHPVTYYSAVKRLAERGTWPLWCIMTEEKRDMCSVYLPWINKKEVSRNMKWIFMRMLDIKNCSLSLAWIITPALLSVFMLLTSSGNN